MGWGGVGGGVSLPLIRAPISPHFMAPSRFEKLGCAGALLAAGHVLRMKGACRHATAPAAPCHTLPCTHAGCWRWWKVPAENVDSSIIVGQEAFQLQVDELVGYVRFLS